MRCFFHDQRGSAVIWTAFLILIFFALAFAVYTGAAVYAQYQTCETELERAAIVTVDMGMVNSNVRDLSLDIPAASAQSLLEENLTGAGWTREDGIWVKRDNGKLIYSLEAMHITVEGKTLRIDATFAMPLPWVIGGRTEVTVPIAARCKVIFLD